MLGAWVHVLGASEAPNAPAVSLPTMLFTPPGDQEKIHPSLKPKCHYFYPFRVADFDDSLPKYTEGSKSELVVPKEGGGAAPAGGSSRL